MGIVLLFAVLIAIAITFVVLRVALPYWPWWVQILAAVAIPVAGLVGDYAFGAFVVSPAVERRVVEQWHNGALLEPPTELGRRACLGMTFWGIYPAEVCSERQPSGTQYSIYSVGILFWVILGAPLYSSWQATLREDEAGQMCMQRRNQHCEPV